MRKSLDVLISVKNERGATAIEYALIATLIALGLIAALQGLGGGLNSSIQNTANAFT